MLSRLCQHGSTGGGWSGLKLIVVPFATRTLGTATRASARQNSFAQKFGQQTGFGVRERVGPTLRERLLGPTTGKPFVYGTYALAGASMVGVGMLCYYGLNLSSKTSIMDRSAMWPTYVRERLHQTYGYLGASLGVTAGAAMAATRSPVIMRLTGSGTIMSLFATLAVIIGTGMIARSIPYESTGMKHAAWLLHCGAMGAVLAPLVFLGGPVLMRAAWYTAGIVAGLTATAITAPSEQFLSMAGPLAMGLGVVFVANIGTFFLPPGSALGASLASVVVYGGLILFSLFLLYDTQRVVKLAEMYPRGNAQAMPGGYYDQRADDWMQAGGALRKFDPINAQLSIYMDVLNIFIRMAMIMGGVGGGRRK